MTVDAMSGPVATEPERTSLLNDPRARSLIFQVALVVGLVLFFWWIASNTAENLARAGVASGFAFLERRAGFDIGQSVIEYSREASYGRAILAGLMNTLLVAVVGIVIASALGFIVGIGRLSRNLVIRSLATTYVEIFRNIPPLLVIFFWYFGVLAVLPNPRDALRLGETGISLSNRGIITPLPVPGDRFWLVLAAFAIGIVATVVVRGWARRRQMATGQQFPVGKTTLGLLLGLPLVVFLLAGMPLSFEMPTQTRFNISGGFQVQPEFIALLLALSIYTGAFIAEIVRAGILAVSHGQTEAAGALGLRHGTTMRLVIIPQALRVIIPPLTSQYLNLTKNSSLAVAIGYADLVSVGGTVLNQTAQAVEIVAIWMAVYLTISLVTSFFMNWFNAKMALVER